MKKITPFVKWVGGKRQIMPDLMRIIERFPEVKRYHEPFVGGGALLMSLINEGEVRIGSINDLNTELITTYRVIRDSPESLLKELEALESGHNRFQFYDVRKMDRDGRLDKANDIIKAARMIYLNKAGYNGIYRVNSKNEFNVPIGSLWNVSLFDRENIMNISKKFKQNKIQVFNSSYEYILEVAQSGDLIYFDPPYDSFEEQTSFVGYQKEGFTRIDQTRLKNVCDQLVQRGANVIISNHNTEFIKGLYGDEYYIQEVVSVNRSVNSNARDRSKKPIEVIIYGGNYEC